MNYFFEELDTDLKAEARCRKTQRIKSIPSFHHNPSIYEPIVADYMRTDGNHLFRPALSLQDVGKNTAELN